jgi:type IV pilus assembly protein PilW
MPAPINKTDTRQLGMTLIESMVAMTISTMLILGSIQMYAQARSNYRTTESISRMQENLRFSIDILVEDVRLAGYWGKTSSASSLEGQKDVTVTCRGNDVSAWIMQTTIPIVALQQESDLDPNCRGTNSRENSDVLIIRHAKNNQNTAPKNGAAQLRSNSQRGTFFDMDTDPGSTAMELDQVFDVAFSAYYISNESKYDASLPSLRRLSLIGNRIEDQEIIPGVENLQVQFGIDVAPIDGQIDMYVNGDDPRIATGSIVSTRLWLLVRSEKNEAGQGYSDNRGPYVTPDAGIEPIDPQGKDAADYPPTYRRMALSRTIALRNLMN